LKNGFSPFSCRIIYGRIREDTDKVTPKENRQRHAGTEDCFVHQSGF
jgi:hypothetical protein